MFLKIYKSVFKFKETALVKFTIIIIGVVDFRRTRRNGAKKNFMVSLIYIFIIIITIIIIIN
jgi:heme O synthase-like polyprenyltransferase